MINNKTLKKEIAAKFTEDFIVKEINSIELSSLNSEIKLYLIYYSI